MKRLPLLSTAILVILITAIFNSCSKNGGSNASPKLAITALNINSGPFGTLVTITGSGFSTTVANNKVYFNGVAALLADATPTQIHTIVPLTAGTGNVTITVSGVTATGPVFTYQPAEVISTIIHQGSAAGTGIVTGLFTPKGIVADAAGNLYIADQGSNVIRKVTTAGVVSTFAGTGQLGMADGASGSASFNHPAGMAIDGAGNIYVCDNGGLLVRKITPAGVVSTLAGNSMNQAVNGTGSGAGFSRAIALAADGAGNIFVADQGAGQIRKITPSGVVTSFYGGGSPYALTIDKTGNIFVADAQHNDIFKITAAGSESTFAGGGGAPVDQDGTGIAASIVNPYFITIDANGNLYVIDDGNVIRKITPGAVVTTFTGHGSAADGPIATSSLIGGDGITIDASGNIYVIDAGVIRKISFQ
ncbi:MAG TPA: IPT/TIG domain-containing protein [Mucilaginibacter sp.]